MMGKWLSRANTLETTAQEIKTQEAGSEQFQNQILALTLSKLLKHSESNFLYKRESIPFVWALVMSRGCNTEKRYFLKALSSEN